MCAAGKSIYLFLSCKMEYVPARKYWTRIIGTLAFGNKPQTKINAQVSDLLLLVNALKEYDAIQLRHSQMICWFFYFSLENNP